MFNEDYLLGYIPARDGSDYDSTFESPTWADLLDALDELEGNTFEIAFVGMGIYDASASETGIGGVSGVVNKSSVERVGSSESWNWQVPTATNFFAQQLLGTSLLPTTPEHITGIVIKMLA